jgi:hypothetical protein
LVEGGTHRHNLLENLGTRAAIVDHFLQTTYLA